MSLPPIPAKEIESGILRVIREMNGGDEMISILSRLATEAPTHWADHLRLEHEPGGPSSILGCRRATWYQAHDTPPDHTPPEWWKYRAMMGTMQETFWMAVLGLVDPKLQCEYAKTEIRAPWVGTPDAHIPWLVGDPIAEFKSINNYGFKKVRDHGAYHGHEEHFAQCQIYMYLTESERCLYLATAADPSKIDPWFVVEWIQYDQKYVDYLIHKKEGADAAIAMDTVAPRDFNPIPKNTKDSNFPCGSDRKPYCRWRASCLEAG